LFPRSSVELILKTPGRQAGQATEPLPPQFEAAAKSMHLVLASSIASVSSKLRLSMPKDIDMMCTPQAIAHLTACAD
jgi:hypothetical protein